MPTATVSARAVKRPGGSIIVYDVKFNPPYRGWIHRYHGSTDFERLLEHVIGPYFAGSEGPGEMRFSGDFSPEEVEQAKRNLHARIPDGA